MVLLSVFFEQVFKVKMIGLTWIFTRFVQSNMIIIEFDLALSAFIVLINWTQNISLFIISSILSLFQAVYLQEYAIRKNPFYVSSAYHYICFRLAINIIYLSNNLLFYFNNEEKFYLFYMFFGILCCVWYFKKGWKLFPQRLL
jgi:hypothetical protein